MSRIARDFVRRLAAAGVDASVSAALVNDMAASHAEAINREGLRAQIAYLLGADGPGEIESLAVDNRPRGERP